VKGAARVWVRLRRGTALSVSAQRGAALGGAGALLASGWCVCTGSRRARAAALALGTLAPVRGGFCAACVRLDAPWEAFAAWVPPPLASESPYHACPTMPGALRVGFWWSARLVKGAMRAA
jgi:hypothetical protein